MGKISKYSNIYDKNGNLLRHVNDDGVLKSMTMDELESLIDKLAEDKDEDGSIKNPQALNNVNQVYFTETQKPKNKKILAERFSKMQEESKAKKESKEAENEQIERKLLETMEQLKKDALKEKQEEEQERPSDDPEYSMDKYVEFEEVPAAA